MDNWIWILDTDDFTVDYNKERGMYRVSHFNDSHFKDEVLFEQYGGCNSSKECVNKRSSENLLTRDEFVSFMKRDELLDMIFVAFEEMSSLFETETYIFHNNCCGDVSIIDKYSLDKRFPRIINWYKLYHVGRALNITGFDDMCGLEYHRALIAYELSELLRKKGFDVPVFPDPDVDVDWSEEND